MYKLKHILLIFLLIVGKLYSQNGANVINTIAIDCKDLSLPNDKLYSFFKDYKCICVGEMHGTKEPAEFLVYLTKLFTEKNKKIIIGIELPKYAMTEFIEKKDSISLTQSGFFSSKSVDGRNSEAWFNAINECSKLKTSFCFFDGYQDNFKCGNIIECYNADTNSVILTLSGNVHNKLLPYKDNKTMGCYLKEYFGNKIFTINHIFNEGTMYNLTSEGLRVSEFPPKNNVFATSTNYSNYFVPNVFSTTDGYSGYYYTTFMTASLPYKKNYTK